MGNQKSGIAAGRRSISVQSVVEGRRGPWETDRAAGRSAGALRLLPVAVIRSRYCQRVEGSSILASMVGSNNKATSSVSLRDIVEEAKSLARILKSNHGGNEQSSGSSSGREPLKVIGAGLGRTGTSSLKLALEELGYKTYHMDELALSGHAPVWANYARLVLGGDGHSFGASDEEVALRRKETIDVMANAGYNATTDFPACLIFEELMDTYPDARVILSVRSSGQVWAESVRKTIARSWPTLSKRPWGWFPQLQPWQDLMPFIWTSIGVLPLNPLPMPTDTLEVDLLAKAHDRWAERVRSVVPPERLLVHTSSDGYGPLCSFLGVSDGNCPSEEYPHSNEAEEMVRTFNAMDMMALGFDTCITVATIALAGFARIGMKKWRKTSSEKRKLE